MASKYNIAKRTKPAKQRIKFRDRSLRSKITLIGLSLVIIVCLVILLLPYLPRLSFLFNRPQINSAPYQEAAKNKDKAPPDVDQPGNRLILPGIGVNAQIIEGTSLKVIGKNQGVWRESRTTDPTKDGNIVLAGHRFLYTARNGGYFYNLPEMKNGEKIFVKWDNKVYAYEIFNTRTVLPTQVDIRNADRNNPRKLTLYTCYPLGSTAKRFVVEARLIE